MICLHACNMKDALIYGRLISTYIITKNEYVCIVKEFPRIQIIYTHKNPLQQIMLLSQSTSQIRLWKNKCAAS